MLLVIKNSSLLFIFFICLCGWVKAQVGIDLFDKDKTREFAQFLINSKQYNFAAFELERLQILSTKPEPWIQAQLLRTYRLSGKPEIACLKAERWIQNGTMRDSAPALEFCKALAQNHRTLQLRDYLMSGIPLDTNMIERFFLSSLLIEGDWQGGEFYLSKHPQLAKTSLAAFLSEEKRIPYRSPTLAATLSALVPGSGKVYAGRWKDGAFSFLIISGMSWRALKGFQEKGLNSEFGWGFGLAAATYYIGNIWGSAQAAKVFNQKKRYELEEKVLFNLLGDR